MAKPADMFGHPSSPSSRSAKAVSVVRAAVAGTLLAVLVVCTLNYSAPITRRAELSSELDEDVSSQNVFSSSYQPPEEGGGDSDDGKKEKEGAVRVLGSEKMKTVAQPAVFQPEPQQKKLQQLPAIPPGPMQHEMKVLEMAAMGEVREHTDAKKTSDAASAHSRRGQDAPVSARSSSTASSEAETEGNKLDMSIKGVGQAFAQSTAQTSSGNENKNKKSSKPASSAPPLDRTAIAEKEAKEEMEDAKQKQVSPKVELTELASRGTRTSNTKLTEQASRKTRIEKEQTQQLNEDSAIARSVDALADHASRSLSLVLPPHAERGAGMKEGKTGERERETSAEDKKALEAWKEHKVREEAREVRDMDERETGGGGMEHEPQREGRGEEEERGSAEKNEDAAVSAMREQKRKEKEREQVKKEEEREQDKDREEREEGRASEEGGGGG